MGCRRGGEGEARDEDNVLQIGFARGGVGWDLIDWEEGMMVGM